MPRWPVVGTETISTAQCVNGFPMSLLIGVVQMPKAGIAGLVVGALLFALGGQEMSIESIVVVLALGGFALCFLAMYIVAKVEQVRQEVQRELGE